MPRDLADYTKQYQRLPFEAIQASYRRRLVLERIAQCKPRRLLEVGCGLLPLFTDLNPAAGMAITVVEPTPAFVARAKQLAAGRADVQVVADLIEHLGVAAQPFEMVVLSCVLHEVEDPQAMLGAVRRQCGPATRLHVNVPNARSLHRLLAVAMGLIAAPEANSETQHTMQQRGIFDADTLAAELGHAGFEVVEAGSLFVKPFTHAQMQQLVDQGFMTPAMLDGLDRLVSALPDLGSEIWVDARLRDD